jgi:hypothetical protein
MKKRNSILLFVLFLSSFLLFLPNSAALTITYDFESEVQFDGNYRAAYSFTTDTVGNNPSGWDVLETSNSYVTIIDSLDGHKKVLHAHREASDTNWYPTTRLNFSYAEFTVELWFRAGQTDKWWRPTSLRIRSDYLDAIVIHAAGDGKLKINIYYDGIGGTLTNLQDYSANEWYHLRVSYKKGTGSDSEAQVWVNGILKFNETDLLYTANCSRVTIGQGHELTNSGDMWIDAIDFSWSSGYYLNRNCYKVIPSGINTNQHYAATIDIVDDLDGRTKVIELRDDINTQGIGNTAMFIPFSNEKNGAIEFYVRNSDLSHPFFLFLRDNDVIIITLKLWSNEFKYQIESTDYTITSASSNVWYYVKVEWNATGWQVIIDNYIYGFQYSIPFYSSMIDGIDEFVPHTASTGVDYSCYIDNIVVPALPTPINWTLIWIIIISAGIGVAAIVLILVLRKKKLSDVVKLDF